MNFEWTIIVILFALNIAQVLFFAREKLNDHKQIAALINDIDDYVKITSELADENSELASQMTPKQFGESLKQSGLMKELKTTNDEELQLRAMALSALAEKFLYKNRYEKVRDMTLSQFADLKRVYKTKAEFDAAVDKAW